VNSPQLIFSDTLKHIAPGLKPKYKYGVIYYDGQFNDSKLAVETVLTATSLNLEKKNPESVNFFFKIKFRNIEEILHLIICQLPN
jgi:glycerol-3-phosphate dehydrogenase